MKPDLGSVLILYNIPRDHADNALCAESEAGVLEEVKAVEAALRRLGVRHRTLGVKQLGDVLDVLASSPEPIVFNLVEGFHRRANEANLVPELCRGFGKASTGCPAHSLILAQDKWRAKRVLQHAGLPVAPGVLVPPGGKVPAGDLPPPPWIVKPARSDASEGISAGSSIFTKTGRALLQAVRRIHTQFCQPALIEQLVGCRELNVSVLQRGQHAETLPIAEIDFSAFGSDRPRIVDYAAKWLPDSFEFRNTPRLLPAPLSKRLQRHVRELSLAAWEALDCLDYARVDFRLDADNAPIILEVNPNPDISPDSGADDAGFVAALTAAGMDYEDFVRIVLSNASARLESARSAAKRPKPARPLDRPPAIRRTRRADRAAILRLVTDTGFFRPNEIVVAQEVLDDALAHGTRGEYHSFTALLDGRVAGWVCFGPTPCTLGTFDLYWIAVAPHHQGSGVGTSLVNHTEKLIARRGGRLVIVETSGQPAYDATRRFYLRLGYAEHARIADFYAPGDDKVIYLKRLP